MNQQKRSPLHSSVFAVGVTAVALIVALLLRPFLEPDYFLPFMASVVVSAWLYGRTGGLITTASSAIVILYFFLRPDPAAWRMPCSTHLRHRRQRLALESHAQHQQPLLRRHRWRGPGDRARPARLRRLHRRGLFLGRPRAVARADRHRPLARPRARQHALFARPLQHRRAGGRAGRRSWTVAHLRRISVHA